MKAETESKINFWGEITKLLCFIATKRLNARKFDCSRAQMWIVSFSGSSLSFIMNFIRIGTDDNNETNYHNIDTYNIKYIVQYIVQFKVYG